MDDALGDALAVEACELLDKVEVFQEHAASGPRSWSAGCRRPARRCPESAAHVNGEGGCGEQSDHTQSKHCTHRSISFPISASAWLSPAIRRARTSANPTDAKNGII